MSVLNNDFTTKYKSAPFNHIKPEDYLPAFDKAIEETKKEIDYIVKNNQLPSFKNTIEALAFSGMHLDVLSNIFFNLNSAETNDELQTIAQQLAPKLAELSNDITLNQELFDKVKSVYDKRHTLDLTTEQNTLLDKNYKNFVRNGALLNHKEKEELRKIDMLLSKISLSFGENVLAETNNYQLHITDEILLEGLPESPKKQAENLAKQMGKTGWIFTLDYPSYLPFMTYVKNRELRKEFSLAQGRKAYQNNSYNNVDNVMQIVKLRHTRANLLGYKSHADFVLEQRMAQSPDNVYSFLNDLLNKARPAALKEFAELSEFAKQLDGIDQLQKWDTAYYSEKLKQKLFNLDDETLKPYFPLESVLQGAFKVANKLFGLNFKKITDIQTYHPQVTTFEVSDQNGNFISLLYTDFFPRKGKRNGAWMTSFRNQYIYNGVNHRPHISIVCNFTPPTKDQPSLLTFNEVTTLFHEFGHALHGMLANTTYPSLSGTNVFWDFVELPSQIFENWCYEKQALELFAKHYQTSQVIPMELIDRIKQSASFQEGLATLRQLSFGLLDMEFHSQDPNEITDLKTFEKRQFQKTDLYPDIEQTLMSTSFSHIFQGGYSAGYYSYKWAEVLDADAFAYFQEKGIFNKEVADKFKDHILSQGATKHPMELYKDFRGQEPKSDALLKRAGLI
ncbi:M3 family metallopeptidase [Myroides sp. LJL110]